VDYNNILRGAVFLKGCPYTPGPIFDEPKLQRDALIAETNLEELK